MIDRRPVTLALRDLITTATGRPCGLGTVPLVNGAPAAPPYYVLDSIAWTVTGAPVADMGEDATAVYQVTGISGPVPGVPDSRGGIEQAEWLADKARTAVVGRDPVTRAWLHPITVPGVRVIGRRVDTEPGATNRPDDATIPYVIRFALDLATA